MTYISGGLVLSQQPENSQFGLIGYLNNFNESDITATSSNVNNPASNLANTSTSYRWRASSGADQVITIQNNGQVVSYVGIARHNLNAIGASISISFDGNTVVPSTQVNQNQALLFNTNEASPNTITINISGASAAASIAVLYAGPVLRLQRSIYVGHTPITMGENRKSITGMSQSGQYMGEIILNRNVSTSVNLKNLEPDWYRSNLQPFIQRVPREPCFWAWKPDKYPAEVGYCWIEGNPRPSNSLPNGMMEISWNFRGIL